MFRNKWSKDTLLYAAGFLDGEGCFTSGPSGKICVTMANTYRPVVEWFRSHFGGNISRGEKRQAHHRLCYVWCVTGSKAEELCRSICVFLKEKSPQAALLISLRQTQQFTHQGKRTPQDIKDERIRLATILKGLKHVEW